MNFLIFSSAHNMLGAMNNILNQCFAPKCYSGCIFNQNIFVNSVNIFDLLDLFNWIVHQQLGKRSSEELEMVNKSLRMEVIRF